jgi:hypothetical protein
VVEGLRWGFAWDGIDGGILHGGVSRSAFFPHGCIYLVTASEEDGSKGVFCIMKQELRFGCAVHMNQRRTVNMY